MKRQKVELEAVLAVTGTRLAGLSLPCRCPGQQFDVTPSLTLVLSPFSPGAQAVGPSPTT